MCLTATNIGEVLHSARKSSHTVGQLHVGDVVQTILIRMLLPGYRRASSDMKSIQCRLHSAMLSAGHISA